MSSNWFKLAMKATKAECRKKLLLKGMSVVVSMGAA